jgi:hypothetical protein
MTRKTVPLIVILVLVLVPLLWAQPVQPRKLVDCPTAGLLPRGSFDVDLRLFPGGGALGGISVGLTERLLLGVSYGGEKIISEEKIDWFPQAGISIKYRVLEENYALPALAVGFDSQGYGAYVENDSISRYSIKSKGFYWVASKNYKILGASMGLHLGANYSMEDADGDDDPSVFLGLDKEFNEEFSVVIEYDFAFNDNKKLSGFGKGNGYMDLGLRWSFGDRLTLELDFMNLTRNRKEINYLARQVRIVYLEYF